MEESSTSNEEREMMRKGEGASESGDEGESEKNWEGEVELRKKGLGKRSSEERRDGDGDDVVLCVREKKKERGEHEMSGREVNERVEPSHSLLQPKDWVHS